MKTMAEVLAEHNMSSLIEGGLYCFNCDVTFDSFRDVNAHQSAALAAAGYGPVKEARMAWHDAVSGAYVDGALSGEAADLLWNANPFLAKDAEP